jgi:hypothetical protein
LRYAAAPACSGKTSSILSAFLQSNGISNGATHYIYMAFFNNEGRSFKVYPPIPSSQPYIAEMQGAAFMLRCVQHLLEKSR